MIPTLIGFRNKLDYGKGFYINFILSNDAQSTLGEGVIDFHTNMIPADALNKIRRVDIYYF